LGGCAPLPFGFSRQQIRQSFGFIQIHSAISKGAAGKFASLRASDSGEIGNRIFNGAHHGAATMEMELNQIFARCRVWTGKDERQRLI
jgi:hypothetical protein